MKNNFAKWKPYICLAILLLSLIPLIWLGCYNYPTGDDYYYGAETHLVWQQTGSITQALAAACAGVADSYQIWQGTYSALFLMYLAPNVFFQYCLSSGDFRDPAFIVRRYFLSAASSVPPFSAGNLRRMDHRFFHSQLSVYSDSGISK